MDEIKLFLSSKGIDSVEFDYFTEEFEPFSYCGSHITSGLQPAGRGTLGCFVTMARSSDLYFITANHVLNPTCSVDLLPENQEIGRSFLTTPDVTVGIVKDIIYGQCNVKLRNSGGGEVNARFFSITKRNQVGFCGRKVYIRGATTSPGFGKITCPWVRLRNGVTYMKIKDWGNNPFAEKGDSGSIVCIEDGPHNVKALALFVGRGKQNSDNDYRAIHLRSCLRYLSRVYNSKVSLKLQ